MERSRNDNFFRYRVCIIISYQREVTASNVPVAHAPLAAP